MTEEVIHRFQDYTDLNLRNLQNLWIVSYLCAPAMSLLRGLPGAGFPGLPAAGARRRRRQGLVRLEQGQQGGLILVK